MRPRMLILLVLFTSCLLCAQVSYQVQQVNCAISFRGCLAFAINDRGDIAGTTIPDPLTGFLPMLWQDGAVQVLGDLQGGNAVALNNRDDVVGETSVGAFLWEDGILIDMGAGACSNAFGVNNRAEVVGSASDCSSSGKPFIWKKGVLTLIAPDNLDARAINDGGELVGCLFSADTSQTDLAVWRNGTVLDLGTFNSCDARGINNRGEIIANFQDDTGGSHSLFWDKHQINTLQPLPGDDSTQVLSLNERGEVTGVSFNSQVFAGNHPVLWRHLVPIDLNSRVPADFQPLLGTIVVENNRGQIVVSTGLSRGKTGGVVYLLTPSGDDGQD